MVLQGCGAAPRVPSTATVPVEASCALVVLARYLQDARGPDAARLFVMGRARWLGTVLQRLPPHVTVVLVDQERIQLVERLALAMWSTNHLLLFAEDRPSQLGNMDIMHHIPTFTRKLLWASTSTTKQREQDVALAGRGLVQTCSVEARIALTAPDGSTTFYKAGSLCSRASAAVDRWLPVTGWAKNVSLYMPVCDSWSRLSPTGVMTLRSTTNRINGFHIHSYPIGQLLRLLADAAGVRYKIQIEENNYDLMESALKCGVDLMSTARPLHPIVHVPPQLVAFPWSLMSIVLVVPSGMGRPRGLLHQLSEELQPTLWLAIGAAALVVAAGLLLLAPRRRQQHW